MTILDDTSTRSAAPAAIRKAFGYFTTGLARLINCWIAALIAHREYQAKFSPPAKSQSQAAEGYWPRSLPDRRRVSGSGQRPVTESAIQTR